MANYQFQQPAFVQPQDYSWIGKSIDNLFNAYARGKQLSQQMQLGQAQVEQAQNANAAGQANFALQNQGLSPQDVNANMGAAMQPGSPATPPSLYSPAPQQQPQAPNMSQQPQSGGPGYQPGQFSEDPKVGILRNIMAMHMQGQRLGAAQQVAGLQKTTAEAGKIGAEASLAQGQADILNGSEGVVGHYVDQIKSGRMKYDDLSNLGRGDVANAIRTSVGNALANQGVNVQGLSNQASAGESLAKGGAIPKANTQSLQSALDVLDSLNQDTPRESLQLINKYGLALAAQKGDRPAARLLNQSALVSDMFQNNFGGGSDKKLELAARIGDPAQKTAQLGDAIQLMHADLKNRTTAYSGKQGTEHPKFSDSQGGVVTRTLKNGETVRVRPVGNGQFVRVP